MEVGEEEEERISGMGTNGEGIKESKGVGRGRNREDGESELMCHVTYLSPLNLGKSDMK